MGFALWLLCNLYVLIVYTCSMEYELSREIEIAIGIAAFALVLLILWEIRRNNKRQLDTAINDQPESLMIWNYRVEANFIELLKTAVIFSFNSFFFIIIPTSLLVIFVAGIWPISLFWLVVFAIGVFIFGFFMVSFMLVANIYFRPYPRTILYHELSGFFRRQGKYVWTVAHQPFIVVDAYGISGMFTLPWYRVYKVEHLDPYKLQIRYNRRPRWLVNLLQADSFVLTVESKEEARRVVDLWNKYVSK